MLGRVLQVVAPDPSNIQNFEYYWKLIKTFYTRIQTERHIDDTNIPYYLEQMLQILIKEQEEVKEFYREKMAKPENHPEQKESECMNFILENKPLDLLVDLAISEKPVGCRQWVLKWVRRYLTCLENPVIAHGSVFKPILKMMTVCNGNLASPYEMDEILFLEAVAGLIGKTPEHIRLFIPPHQFSDSTTEGIFNTKPPKDNQLFSTTKIEPNIRRVSLMVSDDEEIRENGETSTQEPVKAKIVTPSPKKVMKNCNCDEGDRFILLDAIMSYLESADSKIVVRACESALILVSLKQLKDHCIAVNSSFTELSHIIGEKLFICAEQIPEDMDLGDIEEFTASWGLFPKDDHENFIGRYQLMSFLCWLDFADCLAQENLLVADIIGMLFREQVLEKIIEPNLLEVCAPFGLVMSSKIIKQIRSEGLQEEVATWLVGTEINGTDCLLNILIENAQDNPDVLLQTLQLVEALLDNPNERILHSMIFIYLNTRGYYDFSRVQEIESWSDEEENREKRRGSIENPMKSKTMAPNNILKVINNFLLLLPRQMAENVGTCYEEYMQDASRHYQMWIKKTSKFHWPVEATSPRKTRAFNKSPTTAECNDSGISTEEFTFYEGPLLRLLFNQVRNMGSQPYEMNLASIAILSKLALLPHPFLHELLLNTEVPLSAGASSLFTVIQALSKKLLTEIPRYENFQTKIRDTAKRLLTNPPLMNESEDSKHKPEESDPIFEALIVLEEFCKELAAIAFIKYHHATEES